MKFKYKQIGTGLGFCGNNLLENILKSRGIKNPKQFLNVNERNIEDFHLFDNMKEGVNLLISHLKNNSKIGLLVDCDSDGFTSCSLIYQYIKNIYPNINIKYLIHNGKQHGLTNDIMLQIEKEKFNLVILPDSGTNDFSQHRILKDNNIDVLVLDHHDCDDGYSKDAIVINNQLSSKITDKALTGVGVVYKFCQALDEYLNVNYADNFLDLVALGIIADSADLRNLESRYLVLKGLNLIAENKNKNKFISKLVKKQAYSMKNKVTIMGIAFYISPLINSVIRSGTLEENQDLFKAFIGVNETRIDKIRGKGEVELSIEDYGVRLCEKLKRKQNKIVDKAVELLDNQIYNFNLNNNAIIVINGENIEPNYTGLIANKIASKYQKPCILMKKHNDVLSGSGRGYDKSNITNLRKWCLNTNLFNYASGHDAAFGLSIKLDNINKLYTTISMLPNDNILNYTVDAILNDKTLNSTLIEQVASNSEIWGNHIDEPLFAIENLIINSENIKLMGTKKNTIKFVYKGIIFIKFKTNEDTYNSIIKEKQNKFTIIGRFSINEYNNIKTPQVIIENWSYEKSKEIKKFVF